MSEPTIIAGLSTIGVIVTAVCGVLVAVVSRQRRAVKAIEESVVNSHIGPDGKPYLLRDNIDANQVETLAALGRVEKSISHLRADLAGVKKDVGRLDDRDLAHGAHHERVDDKLTALDDKLDTHLEWSRDYVAGQEK